MPAVSLDGVAAGRDINVHVGVPAMSQAVSPAVTVLCLPSKPTNFVGRGNVFEKLRKALVVEPGMFLLTGGPGSGKSTIAQMFAWQVEKDFEAVVYQTCGQRNVDVIVSALADALKAHVGEHVSQLPPEKKLVVVKSWLEQRRSLLILDDVWLDDAPASSTATLTLQDLLPGKQTSVLFASRRPKLPWVACDSTEQVGAFTPEEVEETFCLLLGKPAVERHKKEILAFAERVERLPIAVAVGAQLLQEEWGPLDEAARSLALEKLRSRSHDVPSLLRHAIEAQGQAERSLLSAAAMCSADGFWLPLAVSIAGLDAETASSARNRLVNAALLRVVDQDRQRFQLHALIREEDRALLPDLKALTESHAQALERLFENWERDWKECRECLAEIIPAQVFLNKSDRVRAGTLNFRAFSTALRIGDLGAAFRIEKGYEEFCTGRNDIESKASLQMSYGNQAVILREWGRFADAMVLHKKEDALCLELGNKNGLQIGYGNQAVILMNWGRLDEAMVLLKQQESLCLELGNKNGLQSSYVNQAVILMDRGRHDEAMALLKRQETLCLELGNKNDLQGSYVNQALILRVWGRLDEAMALLKRQEALCLELGNKNDLQRSYGNQTLILRIWGRLDEAMALLKEQEALCLELGNKDSLQMSYGNQALILMAKGRHDDAMALLKEQEALCLELGNKDSLQMSYGNQALILMDRGRFDEAMALLKGQEALCLELGKKDDLQASYGNQALILQAKGHPDEAVALLKEQEALCLELGNKDGLQASYLNQAAILINRGRFDEAMALLKQQETICVELGNKDGLQASYLNQAVILRARGRLDEAMAVLKKKEALELG